MAINDGFEKLVEMAEVDNDTDLSIEELEQIEWRRTGEEDSQYSIMTATTYVNPEETIAKKVFSDGYTEYYYIA
jgi:hypothetical protein